MALFPLQIVILEMQRHLEDFEIYMMQYHVHTAENLFVTIKVTCFTCIAVTRRIKHFGVRQNTAVYGKPVWTFILTAVEHHRNLTCLTVPWLHVPVCY